MDDKEINLKNSDLHVFLQIKYVSFLLIRNNLNTNM